MDNEMEMMECYNKHYIRVDENGVVRDAWSDGPNYNKDTTGAICINEKGGYQFRLTPDGEENPPMYTMEGFPKYKWDGSKVVERTQEDMADEYKAMNNQIRINEIKVKLNNIDDQSRRPLRAIATGTATDEDKDRLTKLEAEAAELRKELATLV